MFYSQCPDCSSVRVVATEEIGSGDIVVNCESCDTPYNLAWHLLDRLPSIRQNESSNDRFAHKQIESELELPPRFKPDWSLPGLNADTGNYEAIPKREKPAPGETSVASPPPPPAKTSKPASNVAAKLDDADVEATVEIDTGFDEEDELEASVGRAQTATDASTTAEPARDDTDVSKRHRASKSQLEQADASVVAAESVLDGNDESEALEQDDPARSTERAAARRRRRRRRREKARQKAVTRSRYWALGCVGLILLMLLQIRLFYMDTLFRSADTQPLAKLFCVVFSCQPPTPRDLGLLQINNTVVGNHPDIPSALRISTTVTNVAEHDQSYPDVQLTLTDPNGKIISRRTFSPGQYVESYVAGRERLESAETETFVFDISNPSKRAIGFEIELVR